MKPKSTEETKQRILETAQYLFVRKGYFNTSISDIVKESGISIGSVYHHFKNKQYIAKYLYEETMQTVIADLEHSISKYSDLKDKLRAVIAYILSLADNNQIKLEYMLFVKHEEIHEDSIPICLSRPFKMVKELLEDGVKLGKLRDIPIDIMAAGFMGIPLQIIEMKINGVLDLSLESQTEEVFKMCWKAVYK